MAVGTPGLESGNSMAALGSGLENKSAVATLGGAAEKDLSPTAKLGEAVSTLSTGLVSRDSVVNIAQWLDRADAELKAGPTSPFSADTATDPSLPHGEANNYIDVPFKVMPLKSEKSSAQFSSDTATAPSLPHGEAPLDQITTVDSTGMLAEATSPAAPPEAATPAGSTPDRQIPEGTTIHLPDGRSFLVPRNADGTVDQAAYDQLRAQYERPQGAIQTSNEAGTDAAVAAAAADAQRRFGGNGTSAETPPIDEAGWQAWSQETADIAQPTQTKNPKAPEAVTGQQSPAETKAAQTTGQVEVKANTTPDAQATEREKLQTMLDSKQPMTIEQVTRLRELSRTPEQQMQTLRDKGIENWTEADTQKYAELSQGKPAENAQTTEQQMEQVKKDLEVVAEKWLKGEGDQTENMLKLQELRNRADGIKTTAEDKAMAKGFAEAYLKDPKELSKRFAKESQTQKDVREAIQKLMALELQLLNLPKTLEQKRDRRNAVKREESSLRDQLDRSSPTDRAAKTAEWGRKANELAGLRNDIRLLKDGARIINGEKRDLMLLIDTKLGLQGNIRTVFRWAVNHGADAYDNAVLTAHEYYDNE